MQLFRSEDEVNVWSAETGHSKGAVISPERLWTLANRWYDDRLRLDWRRRSIVERQAVLDAVGLTGQFWDLSASND